jgi:membrane-bound serine protease (ClpP class)
VGFGIITVVLLRLALRARRQKALIGPAALVGFSATAMEPLEPAGDNSGRALGRILVQGEIWQATAHEPVPTQASLRVTGFHGDVLEVQLITQGASSPTS